MPKSVAANIGNEIVESESGELTPQDKEGGRKQRDTKQR